MTVFRNRITRQSPIAGTYQRFPILHNPSFLRTAASVVLPVMCLVGTWIPAGIFVPLLHLILAAMGLLFIIDLP